jgi:hypothetical protein
MVCPLNGSGINVTDLMVFKRMSMIGLIYVVSSHFQHRLIQYMFHLRHLLAELAVLFPLSSPSLSSNSIRACGCGRFLFRV